RPPFSGSSVVNEFQLLAPLRWRGPMGSIDLPRLRLPRRRRASPSSPDHHAVECLSSTNPLTARKIKVRQFQQSLFPRKQRSIPTASIPSKHQFLPRVKVARRGVFPSSDSFWC